MNGTRMIWAAVGVGLIAVWSAAQPPPGPTSRDAAQTKDGLWDDSPNTGAYWLWWRPYKIVPDDDVVRAIRGRCDALDESKARSLSLDQMFHENARSAFLYPVLSGQKEKGCIILGRMLAEYAGGKALDDRWLLIVAALGRNAAPLANVMLKAELQRFREEYAAKPGRPEDEVYRFVDPRRPLLDAIMASEVAANTLTIKEVDDYAQEFAGQFVPVGSMALDWTEALAPGRLGDFVLAMIDSCTDADLAAASGQKPTSAKLQAVRTYWGRKSTWPLARRLVLEGKGREKARGFLKTQWLSILVCQADSTQGQYEITREMADVYVKTPPAPSSGLASCCAILLQCKPSRSIAEWETFLAAGAARLDPKDRDFVEYFAKRIRGQVDVPGRPTYEGSPMPAPRTQGVHMLGFEAARNMRSHAPGK
ncbi:MAG: hypothetical protein NTV86_18675 [Planctomycetota bacterium]|nr:hypothetical protein [Planctomycetota bacterium]